MDWSTQSFDNVNQTLKTDIDHHTICNPQCGKKVITFANQKSYFEAKDFCKTFGGEIAPPKSSESHQTVGTVNCSAFWGPYIQGKSIGNGLFGWLMDEGNKTDVSSYIDWSPNQPDGLHRQRCTQFIPNSGYHDKDCTAAACWKCKINEDTVFKLRGIRKQDFPWSQFDKNYFLKAPDKEHALSSVLTFEGLTQGKLEWDMVEREGNFSAKDVRVRANMASNPGRMVLEATHIKFLNPYFNNVNTSLERFQNVKVKFTQVFLHVTFTRSTNTDIRST